MNLTLMDKHVSAFAVIQSIEFRVTAAFSKAMSHLNPSCPLFSKENNLSPWSYTQCVYKLKNTKLNNYIAIGTFVWNVCLTTNKFSKLEANHP